MKVEKRWKQKVKLRQLGLNKDNFLITNKYYEYTKTKITFNILLAEHERNQSENSPKYDFE